MTTAARTVDPHLPALRGHLWPGAHARGRSRDAVRGDADDVFSKGFICPKGASIGELHDDPDRARARRCCAARDGGFDEVSWEEAFTFIDERLRAIDAEHGREAMAMYLGNPAAHHLGPVLYGRVLAKALGTRNIFSASTVDQYPKQLASALMFGTGLSVPIPDLDRTDAPADPRRRPDGLQRLADDLARHARPAARDPRARRQDRRRRPAPLAHRRRGRRAPLHPPGHATRCCCSRSSTCCSTRASRSPGAHLEPHLAGLDEVRELAEPFTPEAVAAGDGHRRRRHPPDGARARGRRERRRLRADRHDDAGVRVARELARRRPQRPDRQPRPRGRRDVHDARRRLGQHRRRARAAGAARSPTAGPRASAGAARCSASSRPRAWPRRSRRPGEGQIRALFTIAGNPVLSTPGGDRLADALDTLDLMVSVDVYVNETTRHADVILPAPSPLVHGHYDIALYAFAVRNVANYSPPSLPLRRGRARRVGDPRAARRHRRRRRAPTPTSPRSTRSSRPSSRGARRGSPAHRSRAATRRSCSTPSPRASGPSACSTCSCAPAPTATCSARARAG